MLLCIDIGNTNTVLATFEGDKIVHSWRVKTDARSTADELGLMFRGLLAGDNVAVTGIAACSTVPAALRVAAVDARPVLPVECRPSIVEPGVRTGVQLAIDNPKEVGSDRVVNTLAAYTLFGGPAIVVDFGTSTNFDVVSGRGRVPRRRARAGHRDLGRRARRPGRPVAQGRAGPAAAGDRQEHRRVPAVRRRATGSPGRSTASSARSSTELASGRRRSSRPVAWPGSCSTSAETITHHEPWLTLIGLRLVYERNA